MKSIIVALATLILIVIVGVCGITAQSDMNIGQEAHGLIGESSNPLVGWTIVESPQQQRQPPLENPIAAQPQQPSGRLQRLKWSSNQPSQWQQPIVQPSHPQQTLSPQPPQQYGPLHSYPSMTPNQPQTQQVIPLPVIVIEPLSPSHTSQPQPVKEQAPLVNLPPWWAQQQPPQMQSTQQPQLQYGATASGHTLLCPTPPSAQQQRPQWVQQPQQQPQQPSGFGQQVGGEYQLPHTIIGHQSSYNGSTVYEWPQGTSPVGHAGSTFNASTTFLPATPVTSSPTDLGCASNDLVCSVMDLSFLACVAGFPGEYTRWLNQSSQSVNTTNTATSATTPTSANQTSSWNVSDSSLLYQGACPVPITTFPPPTPRCYNASTHVCVNNQALCPVNASSLCGNQCYSPDQYRCITSFFLCPSHASSVCGSACYNAAQYECTRDMKLRLRQQQPQSPSNATQPQQPQQPSTNATQPTQPTATNATQPVAPFGPATSKPQQPPQQEPIAQQQQPQQPPQWQQRPMPTPPQQTSPVEPAWQITQQPSSTQQPVLQQQPIMQQQPQSSPSQQQSIPHQPLIQPQPVQQAVPVIVWTPQVQSYPPSQQQQQQPSQPSQQQHNIF